jgi:fluoroquinolone transport system ATP-binding protein
VAVIDVHSFGFTYPGAQRPAVRDVAFSVEPGEIFGFLGPSGAGKSTTQNVLIRLLDGYEGSVAVLGQDLRALGIEATTVASVSRSRPQTTT